jgi:alkanesulfonate monooxygenase SsuD/methylene tetrahydromethanopterin reductase-like flavin-dependent oxidoreductase (luciferase family)
LEASGSPRLKFGCQLPQDIKDFNRLVDIARNCERLGYDSLWVYDHLSPFWSGTGKALECWTLLSAVAARTENVKLGSLVTNVVLRNPSLLAKMSSTVDNISRGRLILGLGAGDKMSRTELESYGYEFAGQDERTGRLRETVLILKAMWTKPEVTFHGKYYQISKAVNVPAPQQMPTPPIWIGGKHDKILDIVAEFADGWNFWGLRKEKLKRCTRYLTRKCAEFGRDPATIVKSWSGTYRQLANSEMKYPELVHNISRRLKDQTDTETSYFIASFDSRAKHASYQAFADAVKGLA